MIFRFWKNVCHRVPACAPPFFGLSYSMFSLWAVRGIQARTSALFFERAVSFSCSASSSVNKITCVNLYLCPCVRLHKQTIDADR